jgi:hypothetical protein
MTTNPSSGATVELSASESWGLLREQLVGRLAVVSNDAHPDIFPVNYIVDHGSIVFRTAAGTKLAAAVDRPVAFEVDGYDPATGEAWSVVVKGTAREVKNLDEVIDALDLPLFPWHAPPEATDCADRTGPDQWPAVSRARRTRQAPARPACRTRVSPPFCQGDVMTVTNESDAGGRAVGWLVRVGHREALAFRGCKRVDESGRR